VFSRRQIVGQRAGPAGRHNSPIGECRPEPVCCALTRSLPACDGEPGNGLGRVGREGTALYDWALTTLLPPAELSCTGTGTTCLWLLVQPSPRHR
jgi:hypothetical protein